jgi:hypothetical protein
MLSSVRIVSKQQSLIARSFVSSKAVESILQVSYSVNLISFLQMPTMLSLLAVVLVAMLLQLKLPNLVSRYIFIILSMLKTHSL